MQGERCSGEKGLILMFARAPLQLKKKEDEIVENIAKAEEENKTQDAVVVEVTSPRRANHNTNTPHHNAQTDM